MSPNNKTLKGITIVSDIVALLGNALHGSDAGMEDALARLGPGAIDAQALDLVRQVQGLVAESRRQRQLSLALSGAASAISSVRRGHSALKEIVTRTRTIVGADMAYISLNDPEAGETRITETDGVWTQAYREIRMPFDTGVLGSVALADGPIQVADYLVSPGLARLEHIDAAVADEGVRSILGAPLRIGGKVIGALLVADRHSHTFSEEQIFVVEALANQAAVAVDNLERMSELTESLQQVETTNRANEVAIRRLERLSAADEKLLAALSSSESLSELSARLTEVIGRPTRLLDLGFRAETRDDGGERLHAARPLIPVSRHKNAPAAGTLSDGTTVVVMASVIEDETVGAVILEGEADADDESLLKRASLVLGTFLSRVNASLRERQRRRTELLGTLLTPPPGGLHQNTIEAAAAHGIVEGSQFRVAIVEGPEDSLRAFERTLESKLGEDFLRASFNDHLYLATPEEEFQLVSDFLGRPGARRWGGIRMAHSDPLLAISSLGAEFSLAERILLAARSLPNAGNLVSWRSLGTVGIFLANADDQVAQRAVDEAVGPLLEYDRRQGTQLFDTALAYLDEARNIGRTAEALFVHPNTVRQRLERIESTLGNDWSSGRRALDLHLLMVVARSMRW